MTTGFEGLAYPSFNPPPGRYSQFEDELLDYEIDWSDDLPTGDPIVSSVWTADSGLVLSNMSFTATTTTVWVSGGKAYYLYVVMNKVTTTAGRVAERKLFFRIKSAAI